MTLTNSLLALNTLGSGTTSDCSGTVNSGGTNLVRVVGSNCAGFTTSDLTGVPGGPFDAYLGPLTDNGGFTPTIAIAASSPAVDAAQDNVCSANPVNGNDQRGYKRASAGSACDIGAYERNATP